MAGLQWDIFCRVVDNLGDAGVCWRLSADLAARGQRVRLVIDDARPLAFMAPAGVAAVQVLAWPGPAAVGDVVIEAFGCALPAATEHAMAQRSRAPVWINLEYLSAQTYVERSHGLPSPQRNGLIKHFFYPGFTPRTGGLLREPGLIAARDSFCRSAWLAAQGVALQPGERVVTLFCYANAAIPALLQNLAQQPTLLLLTPGAAQEQVLSAPPGLRLHRLPWLSQTGFDRLLWSADLNFVRGEDSLVRAIWAGVPFVWQLYPQHDGAHIAKLHAMLAQMAAPAEVAALWRAWNGADPPVSAAQRGAEIGSGVDCHTGPGPGPGPAPWPGLPPLAPWRQALQPWRCALLAQPDLATQLQAVVAARLSG